MKKTRPVLFLVFLCAFLLAFAAAAFAGKPAPAPVGSTVYAGYLVYEGGSNTLYGKTGRESGYEVYYCTSWDTNVWETVYSTTPTGAPWTYQRFMQETFSTEKPERCIYLFTPSTQFVVDGVTTSMSRLKTIQECSAFMHQKQDLGRVWDVTYTVRQGPYYNSNVVSIATAR